MWHLQNRGSTENGDFEDHDDGDDGDDDDDDADGNVMWTKEKVCSAEAIGCHMLFKIKFFNLFIAFAIT